jgi:GAF domain-containing protein/CheY-like chemotaxis protein
MAACPRTNGLRRSACFLALGAALCLPGPAQQRLPLDQLGARKPPNFTPAYAGQTVVARGVVSARAFHFPEYTLLAFEDSRGGVVIEVPSDSRSVNGYQPGDEIEVQGTVSARAGMVTILPSEIRSLGRRAAPVQRDLPLEDLLGFQHLGQLVRTEGRVIDTGETTGGAYLTLSSRKGDYRLFIPHALGIPSASLADFSRGDKVEAAGVALQYCTTAPCDRWFELLVGDTSQLIRRERSGTLSPLAVAIGLGTVLVIGFVLWNRERRLRWQRERLRKTYQLGEEILSASSMEAILTGISESLPRILGVTRVHLYVYNRGTKALNAVVSGGHQPVSISLSSPPGGTHAGAVACFHYRTLLVIPDIDRSPFPIAAGAGEDSPKSLLFVPMLSQGEVAGVLELDQDDRARDFTPDEQALAQHLGNQIGVAIRLLDQRSVQEQLFRTEKLAAVGRLISGVVNELQTPLSSISELASRALVKSQMTPADREVSAIAAEAQKASAIVSRLVSFAAAEQGEARPVCVSTLLRSLIEFRERDWKASGIRVQDLTSPEQIFVLGSHGQLEQAFLTLFVHAEQSLAEAAEKTIVIRTSILGKRLVIEIAFTAPSDARAPQETAAVLGVTRSVIAGHGGEVRLIEKSNTEPRFEVELPLTAGERVGTAAPLSAPLRDAHRRMTALVIEPDDTVQRQLLTLLAARGFRVVPVDNADTGLDLTQRMRFDAAFCSVHAPGLNWVELSERLQSRVGAFILLADHYDAELSADFEGEGRFVVAKPVQEADLERVLKAMDLVMEVRGTA